MRILVVGLSTRAIAESAVRGGHQVVTLDYFGDRDQRALVENVALRRDLGLPFSVAALLQASRRLDFQALVYVSNLENHPDVVEKLARGRVLLGNAPAVLACVRDWRTLRTFCREAGIYCPTTLLPGEEGQADPTIRWLRKPVRSGGGHGVRFWAGERLDEAYVLQAYVEGRPASAVFVADGRRCVLLGLTEQLIGRGELGARGFTWCGNILPLSLPTPEIETIVRSVREMAESLTCSFGLRGVNGLDFILGRDETGHPVPFGCAQDRPYLVEVNPRYTGSMELVERAYGLNVFDAHVRSFDGDLPAFHLEEHLFSHYYGKGIVYARRTVTMPETVGWREKERRDIPFSSERIKAGHPICTALAQGETRDECWRRLLVAAEMVWQEGRQ